MLPHPFSPLKEKKQNLKTDKLKKVGLATTNLLPLPHKIPNDNEPTCTEC